MPRADDPALFDATLRFHHPTMARHWSGRNEDAAFETLVGLLLHGLQAETRD
jgi:hypothetical protein